MDKKITLLIFGTLFLLAFLLTTIALFNINDFSNNPEEGILPAVGLMTTLILGIITYLKYKIPNNDKTAYTPPTRTILLYKKVGTALIIFVCLEIIFLIYISNSDYEISINIDFSPLIAGAFLLRGSVYAAAIVRWLSALFLAMACSVSVLSVPIGCFIPAMFLGPFEILFILLFSVFLYWIYCELSKEASLEELKKLGFQTGTPKLAFTLGSIAGITASTFSLSNSI